MMTEIAIYLWAHKYKEHLVWFCCLPVSKSFITPSDASCRPCFSSQQKGSACRPSSNASTASRCRPSPISAPPFFTNDFTYCGIASPLLYVAIIIFNYEGDFCWITRVVTRAGSFCRCITSMGVFTAPICTQRAVHTVRNIIGRETRWWTQSWIEYEFMR